MKYKLQTSRGKMVITLLAVLLLTSISLSSCVKSSDANPATPFVGTWNGTSTCNNNGPATLIIVAGSGNTVIVPSTVGGDTCEIGDYTLTANGNSLTDTVANTDHCGNSVATDISATINGGTLTFKISQSVYGSSTTCIFTGTK